MQPKYGCRDWRLDSGGHTALHFGGFFVPKIQRAFSLGELSREPSGSPFLDRYANLLNSPFLRLCEGVDNKPT